MPFWIRFSREAPPVAEEDRMDWQQTTPPSQPPRDPYHVPGAWPDAPTPRFPRARPFGVEFELDPAAVGPAAKRVCLGLGRAGAATVAAGATITYKAARHAGVVGAKAAVRGGAIGAKATLRGGRRAATQAGNGIARCAKATGKTVGHSTIHIIRKFNREHPRTRAVTNHGAAYERTRGYESPTFSRLRTVGGQPSFVEVAQAKRQAEISERLEYESKRMASLRALGPFQNPFRSGDDVASAEYLEWLQTNPDAADQVSPETIAQHKEVVENQIPRFKPWKKPGRPSFKRLMKNRTPKVGVGYTLVKYAKKPGMPVARPRFIFKKPIKSSHHDEELSEIQSPHQTLDLSTKQESTVDNNNTNNVDGQYQNIEAPQTPAPQFQFAAIEQTPANGDDDAPMPDTPSRTTPAQNTAQQDGLAARTPWYSPRYWNRIEALFATPNRAEENAEGQQEDQNQEPAETEEDLSNEQQDQDLINEHQDAAETKEDLSNEPQDEDLMSGEPDETIIAEPVSTPVRETEQPSRPGTPSTSYSDISSTCDITPIPYELRHLSLADKVADPSSPIPQEAGTPSPPRDWDSVVGKTPGGWDDETTGKDEEAAAPPSSGPIARRTRGMQVRIKEELKEESVRTPQNEVQSAPKTPAAKIGKTAAPSTSPPRTIKNLKHGTTKTKVATHVQERRERYRRAAEQWKIAGLSDEWIEKVEYTVKHGDQRTGLKAGDFARVAPHRTHGASRDNWLNDETINEYLKIVAAHGDDAMVKKAADDATKEGKKATYKKTHHAFASFFYTNLLDPKKDVAMCKRWAKRAKIDGKKLLDTKFVFIPINSGAHWTLVVVSGVNRTITYYDSLGGKGAPKMQEILRWVAGELGDDFVAADWQLLDGVSGRQNNSDDCGVFTITNARSLMLGEEPEKSFGPDKVRFQRERIVAEIVNGALLPRGA